MEFFKNYGGLVISVLSCISGVYIFILKLHTSQIKDQIKGIIARFLDEKDRLHSEIKELKEEIKNIYDTRVSKEVCNEKCKK